MSERNNIVTFKGNPITLVGQAVAVGDPAPEFKAVAKDLSDVTLSSFKGKIVVISVVPSLDTPVCDIQTRRFNQQAGELGDHVVVLTVSMDLPFAQKRWCGAAGVENVITVSDYKDRQFGASYGVYIKELGLLARAVLVVDPAGVVRHLELVKEVTQEPNYDAAFSAVQDLLPSAAS